MDRAPKASPFTRTPLENKRATPSASVAAGHAPYPGAAHPYTYPPPAQYPAYPPGFSQDATADGTAANEDTGEGSDAWEAAQTILKAINFGSLIQVDQDDAQGAGKTGSSNAVSGIVQDEAVHPPLIVSSTSVDVSSTGVTGAGIAAVSGELGPQERAALQAQLALLAAQMAELANGGDDALAQGLSSVMVGSPTTRMGETATLAEEDNDDDMERVEVPAASNALRT